MEQKNKQLISHLVFVAILIFIGVLITQTLGLSAAGFDDPAILSQFYFYTIAIASFSIGILIVWFVGTLIKDDEKYGNSVSFFSSGEIPAIKTNFFQNPLKLFLLSSIIFTVFGVFTIFTNQTYFVTGVMTLKQQFTPLTNILFSAALVPIAENLGVAFLWAMFMLSFRYFAKKRNISPGVFMFLCILFSIFIFGLYGFLNHILRYGTSTVASLKVAMSWGIFGGLLTVLTGSFIPFWVWHLTNNLFLDLTKYYTNDLISIFSGVSVFFLIILYLLFFMKRSKKIE